MQIGWFDHDVFLDHDTGPVHPERPDRLRAVRRALNEPHLSDSLDRIEPTPIDPAALESIHTADYIQHVRTACESGDHFLDSPDTVICPTSYQAALTAAGGATAACDAVMAGQWPRAFCSPRPPGHHAEADHAMGFCLFNNIALAAAHLIDRHHLARVAIVDFDVHHGNGTQHAFDHRADVLFISLHEHPAYLFPGTGHAQEIGRAAGQGFTLNLPMTPGAGDDNYESAFVQQVIPRLREYQPQFLLISAGFDAAVEDPIAHIQLTAPMFGKMTDQLRQIADDLCHGRIISFLEGGYDLGALQRGVTAHVASLAT